MKKIKYKVGGYTAQYNPETGEVEQVFTPAEMTIDYSEANLEKAKAEAYNGEYEIVDDGVEEDTTPTLEERTSALEAAMLEMMGVKVDG